MKNNIEMSDNTSPQEQFLASIALASQERDITVSLSLARQVYRYLKGRSGCEVLDGTGLDVDNCVYDFAKAGRIVRLSGQRHSELSSPEILLGVTETNGVTQCDLTDDLHIADAASILEEHGYALRGVENDGACFASCDWDKYADCEFVQVHHAEKSACFVAL